MYHLSDKFVDELIRLSLHKKDFLDLMVAHMKYEYLPNKEYKLVFKEIASHYSNTGAILSLGMVESRLVRKDVSDVIERISACQIPKYTDIVIEFERYIKDMMSLEYYDKFVDQFNNGNSDEARATMISGGEAISRFSILNKSNELNSVFGGFERRNEERSSGSHEAHSNKIPFSIDQIDIDLGGGLDPTETFCLLAQSGKGKTKFLRHVAVGAARRGKRGLHIQAEGSKESCLRGYDATWTGVLMSDIRKGSIPDDKYKELLKISRQLRSKGGEIYVHAYEQFDSANMSDVRHFAKDLLKTGKLDYILIDYLELMEPSNRKKYSPSEERFRRLAIANDMKNMALETNSVVGTATQANDIPPKLLEDPEFVMTRHNSSEAKAIINPFSVFLTANQTTDEYDDNTMRLWAEKFRDAKGFKLYNIAQDYDHDRFYDRRGTMKKFGLKDDRIDANE